MNDRRPLFVFLAIGLATVTFLLVGLRPQFSRASEVRSQVAAARSQEQALADQLAALRDLDGEVLAAQAARLGSWLPDDAQLPTFLRQVTRASLNAGVDLRQIAPSSPAAVEGMDASVVTVTLIVEGRYSRIRDLHRRLEGLDRAVKVGGLSMAVSQGADGNSPVLQASITLSMYSVGAPVTAVDTTDPATTTAPPSGGN